MSRTISLEIEFAAKEGVSAQAILQTLIDLGWNPIFEGVVNYLPMDDNEMYNWKKENLTIEHLLEIVSIKEQKEVLLIYQKHYMISYN